MNKPKISIIIPTKNAGNHEGAWLRDCFESILRQTFQDWEVLIMDGMSTDGTRFYAYAYARSDPRFNLFVGEDENSSQAADSGVLQSYGDYIMIMRAQDGFLDKEYLQKAMNAFEALNDVSLVHAATRSMNEDGTFQDEMHVTYSRFFGDKTRYLNLWKKVFSPRAWKKLLSPTRKMRLNFIAGKLDGVPQLFQWKQCWLKTGALFADQTMIVKKEVYLNCTSRYEKGSYKNNFFTEFNYNFNVKGCLPRFIPTLATYGRTHKGNSNDRIQNEADKDYESYLRKIMQLQ